MPANANSRKTLASMRKTYGSTKAAKHVFYSLLNKNRTHGSGKKFLRAIGSQEVLGAASGGRGHAHASKRVRRQVKGLLRVRK